MPVSKMSEKRKKEIFGNGIILPGPKRPSPSSKNSIPLDLQNLPFDPAEELLRALFLEKNKKTP